MDATSFYDPRLEVTGLNEWMNEWMNKYWGKVYQARVWLNQLTGAGLAERSLTQYPLMRSGASIPSEAMIHFPPVSDSPLISAKFLKIRGKCSQFYLFLKHFSISKNLWWPFFTHRLQMLIFLLFSFAEIIIPPTFSNSPLFPRNLRVFYILCVYFVSPYFDHGAFMHHTWHVLDAPGCDSTWAKVQSLNIWSKEIT